MDERNDEQSDHAQPTGPVFSSIPDDAVAEPPVSSPGEPNEQAPSRDFWQATAWQDNPLGSSSGDHGERHGKDDYGPGDYSPGAWGPGSYDPNGYASGGYGGYGGYGGGGYGPAGYGAPEIWPTRPARPRRARKALAVVAVALVLMSAGAGVGIAYLSRSTGSSAVGLATSPAGHSLTTSQIAAAVDPAVVDINTNLGEGTGMIATSSGEIITNNHVIDGVSTIKVSVDNGGTYTAKVVGTDAKADVAVLQLKNASALPTVTFANSSQVTVGNAVVAIGNAGGQGFPSTVTAGAVTALGRTIVASGDAGTTETLTGMIQMDALIEPGNSGGPLVNSSGAVVGMDTAAASADGATPIGFALPMNRVLQIANEIKHGEAGPGIVLGVFAFLGVAGQTVSIGGSTSATGVGLTYVDLASPAALAGIEEGDVIVAFDGHVTATLSELASLIHALRPGDRAKVTFENLVGGTQTATVTLAAAPPS